jgi:hypothetical protein
VHAAQWDVSQPRMNSSPGLSRIFHPLGDDKGKEDSDNFTDDGTDDSQNEDLTGMCVILQLMN